MTGINSVSTNVESSVSSLDHTQTSHVPTAIRVQPSLSDRERHQGNEAVCVWECVLCTCVRGGERPRSPRDSVSHKLHHKAALLSLAWVRPLLSSSNMPATCSHTHTHQHTWAWTHIHAHTSISRHAHAYTNPAHMARWEFIWCFLVIATKTPNLDVSRSSPKTPEWRANFKQLPPLTASTSMLFFPSAHPIF